ncbi:MAG: CHAT domain-containing tetratricopeptide repeat protein [Bacteroidota bacterium]
MNNYLTCFYLCLSLSLFLPGRLWTQNDTLQADNYYYDGKEVYQKGDYENASRLFKEALRSYQALYGEKHERVMKAYYRLGRAERMNLRPEQSLVYLQKSLDIAEQLYGYYSEDVGYTLQAIGNLYDQLYNPRKSSQYFKESILVFTEVYGSPSLEVGGAYMNLGISDYDQDNYQSAEVNFKKALYHFTQSVPLEHKAFNKIYNNLSFLYRQLGDYDKSIDYGKKALEIKLKNYEETHPSVPKYYGNVGLSYQRKNDFEASLPYAQKMVELSLKAVGPDHPDTGDSYTDLGVVYVGLKQYDKGLEYFQKAVEIMKKTRTANDPQLIRAKVQIGKVYEEEMGDLDQALAIYQKTLEDYANRIYKQKTIVANAKRRIARIQLKQKRLDEALRSIQEGLQSLVPNLPAATQTIFPNPAIEQSQAQLDLLQLLALKANILKARFAKSEQLEDLKQAFATNELAISLIEQMRKSYLSDAARQFLNTQTAPIFESAVEQAFELHRLTKDSSYLFKAFKISEKSKASILWQSLNERFALETADIPSEQLDTLRLLRFKITDIEDQLSSVPTPEQSQLLQGQIFELKQAYEMAIASLEQSDPEFYQLKYAPNYIEAQQILDQFPDEQSALVAYFHTTEQVYTFVFSKAGFKATQQNLSFDLSKAILSLRNNQPQNITTLNQGAKRYIQELHRLHEVLIQPIYSEIASAPNLAIIPHGVLQYLSFETLCPQSDQNDFRKLNYLFQQHDLRYTWSAAIWAKRPKPHSSAPQDFVGFAPNFNAAQLLSLANQNALVFRESQVPLSHTITEVEGAQSYFPGPTYLAAAATESQFLQSAPQSKIIHLATHAIANDRFPAQSGLLLAEAGDTLEDGFLSTTEIYNLHLAADLAVMSACNTGYGQLVNGEGVMSLGRAFLEAGCQSILMSLWLANDQSTSIIIQDFYKYAAQGLPKNQALKKAKLDYLQAADPLMAHPYFWANLVIAGDVRPLRGEGRSAWMIWGLLGGLLFVVFFYKGFNKMNSN